MLVKLRLFDKTRSAILKLTESEGGRVLDDSDPRSLILEFVGEHQNLESLLKNLQAYEILEVVRTGNVAMQKGKNVLVPFAAETQG
ncbi:MAG TPA: hypothetical protein DF383_13345, partial [Deltaproteobacteria bacterium]|nr:hypothetical protein [Deltaproteobacteria bacterium]